MKSVSRRQLCRPIVGIFAPRGATKKLRTLLIPAMLFTFDVPTASANTSDQCTPTQTIQLDLPDVNWHDSEKQIRDLYPAPAQKEYGAVELASLFTLPSTRTELLQNFKLAFDRQLFAQRNFFDSRVLRRFFNASSVTWTRWFEKPDPNQRFLGREGVAEVKRGPLVGAKIEVKLELERASKVPDGGHPDGFSHLGSIDVVLNSQDSPIEVKSITEVFGPPPFTFRDLCPYSSERDPRCKGTMDYDIDPTRAIGGGDRIEFGIKRAAVERFYPDWERRTAAGRSRFLCDEDELWGISLHQVY